MRRKYIELSTGRARLQLISRQGTRSQVAWQLDRMAERTKPVIAESTDKNSPHIGTLIGEQAAATAELGCGRGQFRGHLDSKSHCRLSCSMYLNHPLAECFAVDRPVVFYVVLVGQIYD